VRKGGKLPGTVLSESYELEYGTATLELEPERLAAGSRVLIVDDVLATGGTLAASIRLIERAGYRVAGIGVVLELDGLDGRDRFAEYDTHALMTL
jgi:adenine phosphoribosyltransferase